MLDLSLFLKHIVTGVCTIQQELAEGESVVAEVLMGDLLVTTTFWITENNLLGILLEVSGDYFVKSIGEHLEVLEVREVSDERAQTLKESFSPVMRELSNIVLPQ